MANGNAGGCILPIVRKGALKTLLLGKGKLHPQHFKKNLFFAGGKCGRCGIRRIQYSGVNALALTRKTSDDTEIVFK